MRVSRSHGLLLGAAIALLAYGALNAGYALWLRVAFELEQPFNSDAPMYWTVGRGILHGFVPYRDLFETKPPGIFLLSALSLWLTGDNTIGAVTQAVVFATLPFVFGLTVVWRWRLRPPIEKVALFLSAFIFSAVIALYMAERSGMFQVESFGAFFTILYLCTLIWDASPPRGVRSFLAGTFLFLAIFFKEPFLLAAFASAILLCRNTRSFMLGFVIPLVTAVTLAIIALSLLRSLGAFITLYLPYMALSHVDILGSPFWIRGMNVLQVFRDVWLFSPPLASILLLLGSSLILIFSPPKGKTPPRWTCIVLIIIVLYCLGLMVGLSGQYTPHQYIVAVPLYIALFTECLRLYISEKHPPHALIGASLLIALPLSLALSHPQYDSEPYRVRMQQSLRVAEGLDAIMERCGIASYVYMGAHSPAFSLTKVPPQGPLFATGMLFKATNPAFSDSYFTNVTNTSLILWHDDRDMEDRAVEYVRRNFSPTPWNCAATVPPPQGYTYLFRKGK